MQPAHILTTFQQAVCICRCLMQPDTAVTRGRRERGGRLLKGIPGDAVAVLWEATPSKSLPVKS